MDHRLLPDEGYTWLVASAPNAGGFLHRLAIYENTPPLYYLLLTPLPLNDEPWVRLPALIAGVALAGVVFAIARRSLGIRVALLAALGLAIAPYAVAQSNFGRAYMLADLALLCAFWAAVRLAEGHSWKWWWLFWAGAVVAIYSEYNAAATLVPLVIGLTLVMPRPRWRTLALGVLPAVSFVPWLHQLNRSLHYLNITKTSLGYKTVTPASSRDLLVNLFYGQSGLHLNVALRWAALLVLLAALAFGLEAMRRRGRAVRPLMYLLAWAGLGTFVVHAVAAAAGIGVFNVGYLVFLLPLGCLVLAHAVEAAPFRAVAVVPLVAIVLVAFGAGFAVKRLGGDSEPDPHLISQGLRAAGVRTVLTNSAVMVYYLQRGTHVILDRPFDLGRDLQYDCSTCRNPLAVVDDVNVGSGARPGRGPAARLGHYVVRLVRNPPPH
jgi:4-amino-4-deoxy-L-arabinose transferase-like glycosyltransferase